jgi:predicted transcriptional regulator
MPLPRCSLDHARDHVKHHRPIVAPNYNAMREALANGI